MIVAVDVGGTFTDVVAVDDSGTTTFKVPTSAVQSDAIVQALDRLAHERASTVILIHGTTVATNTLLERSGARTLLITDEGFEDVIEIGRQDRPSLYDPFADRPRPLVDRDRRVGVPPGSFEPPPISSDIEAVAIALLDAHENPTGERRIADAVTSETSAPISTSSDVAPEFREYERVSTTVLNAYVGPRTSRYLQQLQRDVLDTDRAGSVAVMRSSGGLMSLEAAAALPAAILLSGPAGGAVAARDLALSLDRQRIISFDMGGTSTDVCRIENGTIDVTYERSIEGYACRLPSVAIHTVGAGGGSIAWIDPGGSLRVGPHSAGAHPGPACYGLGGREPTVTDANVLLGRIAADVSFGDAISIDRTAAEAAISQVADPLGLTIHEAALGIVRIAEDVMAGAVRTVSVEEGVDPAGAWLVAFGGAGGLHASAIARSLGMAGVLVPDHAGVFSALGLAAAAPRADAVASVNVIGDDLAPAEDAADRLGTAVESELAAAGHRSVSVERRVDVRYLGQAHEITVPWDDGEGFEDIRRRFDEAHRRRNGFARLDDPIEIVSVRCVALGRPALEEPLLSDGKRAGVSTGRSRPVVSDAGTELEAWVRGRRDIPMNSSLEGPGVIEDSDATTYVGVGERVVRLPDGTLEVTW